MSMRFLKISASAALAALASNAGAVEVLIPSYFNAVGANNNWTQLNTAASSLAITAILNPASGPGPSLDTKYQSAVNSLRGSGGRVIGYVSTVYGTRPFADVEADILAYKNRYSLDGIFLDEMTNTNDAASLSFYKDIYSYIKTLDPNYRVVGNPGSNTTSSYLTGPAADTVVTFESNTGYGSFNPSSWTTAYATRRFSNLPYSIASSTTMTTYINNAAAKRVGYMYVTDDGADGNPWDRLPTYWSAEISAIRAVTSTWAADTSGDWNKAGAWTTAAAPNGVGAEAFLFGVISAPQTIYTNTNLTLGVLSFNNANRYVLTGAGTLTLDAAVESALIDVRRGDHTINLPLILNDATTVFVAGGSSLTIADPLSIRAGASLTKTGTGSLTMTSLVSDENVALVVAAGSLVIGGDVAVGSLSISNGTTVDLGTSSVTTKYRADASDFRLRIASAYDGGTWSGTGLTSSAVDAHHGIGFATFGDSSLIELALNGDTDLDGSVNFADLVRVADSLGSVGQVWSGGDFDYDGLVGVRDLALLEANYGGDFGGDWKLAQSLVPEPSALALLALFTCIRRARS